MDLGLAGKAALITGASRGIGKAIARALLEEGARVAIAARSEEDVAAAAAELAAGLSSAVVVPLPADVSTEGGARELVARADAALGSLDLLVNNVGGSLGTGTFDVATAEQWARVVDTNLMSAVWCSQEAVARMKARGGGAIVHIGSICGREYCTSGPYTAAKAAITGLTKEMAVDLAPHGIRVNCVAPGSVMFPGGSWDRRREKDPGRIARMIESELPWGRFGKPEEIAAVVAFLCSPRASWVSGANLPVDGAQGRAF